MGFLSLLFALVIEQVRPFTGISRLRTWGGGWIDHQTELRTWFDYGGPDLALMVIAYGFAAAVMPVWLLLAPRDYLSTFMKLGTVAVLGVFIVIAMPPLHMPAVTRFVDGSGFVGPGPVFPFVCITIACGAVSGFHALISSGTTPKLLTSEKDIRLVGYGAMVTEMLVALMAMLVRPGARAAACAVTQLCCASMDPTAYDGVSKLQV